MNGKKIIVALDGIKISEAIRIARILEGKVWGFKVNDLLHKDSDIIKKLKRYGRVFADAKLYDIPNTVSNTVKVLSKNGADIITVHAQGGIEMMQSAKKSAGKSKIIAVTVLTSKKTKSNREVLGLVQDAISAGIDGIVCSGNELESIKSLPGSLKMIKVVPGVRPAGYDSKDDQVRTVTPNQALINGANLIVIGRPITKSKNILNTFNKIISYKD